MADGDPATDGGTGPADDPTGGTQEGDGSPDTSDPTLSEEQMGAIVGSVRESFGLADGQRIDQMVAGASARIFRESFGLKKGQNAIDVLGTMMSERISEAAKASSTPAQNGAEDDANAALRQDLEAVKKTANELAEAKQASDRAAYNERRKGLIRDALADFDINPNVKGLVTRSFLLGVEADPQVSEDDSEALVIKMADGTLRVFGEFLKDYFTENKSFLTQKAFTGSGPKGGDGRPATPATLDFKKSGRELGKEYAQAAEQDSEGALEALRAHNAETAKRLGVPVAGGPS